MAVSIIMLEAYKKFILVALILQGKVCTAVHIIMRLLVLLCWKLTSISIIMWLLVYHVGSIQEVYTGCTYTAREGMYCCSYYHAAVSIFVLEAYKY